MDYQNVHLTAAGLYRDRDEPKHYSLISPCRYASELIRTRNLIQWEGYPHATLDRVLVHRGLPSPEHNPDAYRRNQAQREQWQQDPQVEVTLRPLKYNHVRGPLGREVVSSREKGIDVLCALAVVLEAQSPEIDLVILASQDTDLLPAIEEVLTSGSAKVETASWFDAEQPDRSRELRIRGIWNTRLRRDSFQASIDHTDYQ